MIMCSKNKLLILLFPFLITACSSTRVKDDIMEDYGTVCPVTLTEAQSDDMEQITKNMNKIKLNGQTCIKVKMDKDPARDYYLREYEKDSLPEMPDLP